MKKTLLVITALFFVTALLGAQQRDALKLFRNGRYNEAVEITQDEISSLPDSSLRAKMDSYTVLLWSLIEAGRYKEAITFGEVAKKLSPYDSRISEALGEAYYYKGEGNKALDLFEQYTVQAPLGDRIARTYNFMGEIYISQGNYNHADIAFSTALYHAPSITRWWYRLGYSRELSSNFKEAEKAYNKALKLNPSFTEASRGLKRIRNN